ncbi:MAG: ATP-grasp domain-containing protein [Clostridia bacterium]|nr:ATP-grasp domain-containing protein [Clostridia bacterium]
MKDITVLVTATGAQFMPGLANCLKNNGERKVRLIGVDMKPDETLLQMVDQYYLAPSAKDAGYADRLLEICAAEKVDVLIPFMSAELDALLENRARFEAIGTKVSVSDGQAIAISNNKLQLYQFMKDHGLKTPKFCGVRNVGEVKAAFEQIGYPEKAVCIKATESSGSRGIRIVDPTKSRFDILFHEKPNSFIISYEELITILSERDEMPEMMAMECLPGEEYSVDLLADHGKVLYMAGRESNVNLASIPQEATLTENREAYEIAESVIAALGLDGNADLDFKMDENGHPVLMEINPRIAATLQIFAVGGLNLPYLRVKQLLGEELPEVRVKYGVKMKRRYWEMFSEN